MENNIRELPKIVAGRFVKSAAVRRQPEMLGPELTATQIIAITQTAVQ